MGVRTIHPKAAKQTKGEMKVEGTLSGNGYQPMMGYKPPNKDKIATGDVDAQAAGFLPDAVGENVKIQGYLLPSDNDIVWADENDPTADIKFDEAFKKAVKPKSLWHSSYRAAKRESMRTGKPIMIWFTRTGDSGSPLCKKLREEVYAKGDFKAWAKKNVVRLKIDLSPKVDQRGENGEILGSDTDKRKYAAALKKRYRVLGLPSVIIESPSEGVMANYRGYRGDPDAYFANLKDNVLTHDHNYQVWRRKMAKKGYREWTGTNGLEVFAKLARYQAGNLILIEPDGNKLKTNESQLSRADRSWIASEKARRVKP